MNKAPRIDLTKVSHVEFMGMLACWGGNGMRDTIGFTIYDNHNPKKKRFVENFTSRPECSVSSAAGMNGQITCWRSQNFI